LARKPVPLALITTTGICENHYVLAVQPF